MTHKKPYRGDWKGVNMDFMNDRTFQLIPVGYENRVSTEQLVIIAGFKSPRLLQKHIELLRNSGAVIASTCRDGGGYYRPQTVPELQSYVNTCESRAKNTLRSLKSARKMLRELEPQMKVISGQGDYLN